MTPMRDTNLRRICMLGGGLVLALLIGLTAVTPPDAVDWVPGLLFAVLIVFTMTYGIPLAQGWVSLVPMAVAATYLVMGLVPAGWGAFLGAIVHGWLRQRQAGRWPEQWESGESRQVPQTACRAAMHALGILAGGAIFQVSGGVTPLNQVDFVTLLRLALFGLVLLGVSYLIKGTYFSALERVPLRTYLQSVRWAAVYESGSLVFAVLLALIFTPIGLFLFVLLVISVVVGALVFNNLSLVDRRLGQRARELDTLQAAVQALSAGLNIEPIVSVVYSQISRLMPAREFFVALYDQQTGEVTFPLAVEDGKRVHWRSRQAGNGLMEYVLRRQAPLLIQGDVARKAAELELDHNGREMACWLGVPISAGTDRLGVLALQSNLSSTAYDVADQRMLLTIAAQAAVAIQNARLNARTDESLVRRVQELNSILRTTRDGFMLLDLNWLVLDVNRTLTDWMDIPKSELVGRPVDAPRSDGDPPIRIIGYTLKGLRETCEALADGKLEQKQAMILLGPSMRHIGRTLTPVRDQAGTITGWLLVFRDMTEEIELMRLRDDMTEMLVHDLRSPLTAVMGSVDLMKMFFDSRDGEGFERLRLMAEQNIDRIMRIINQLLDISRLESEQLPLRLEPVDVQALFEDTKIRFAPLATETQITLTVEFAPGVPSACADVSLISRVVDNLLDNAIKFTPDGGDVRLWVRGESEGDSKELWVGVSDTGPGLSTEAQSRLFTKFQQVVSVEGRRRGTGLGLAFCRLAVEAHGGRIWVESEVGEGSTFIFALPAESEQAQP
jgi:NtrC-family two-component system sensor histidine kinase KinB